MSVLPVPRCVDCAPAANVPLPAADIETPRSSAGDDMKPLPHAACPLCGEPNACEVARCGRFDVACWCSRVDVSRESLAGGAAAQRNLACLCPRCAARPPERMPPDPA